MNPDGAHSSISPSSPSAVKVFTQFQAPGEVQEGIDSMSERMEHLDRMILENKTIAQLLREHAIRLSAYAEDPRIHRIPVLLDNKELYVTLDESNLDSVSNSLALRDLLKNYKTMKGIFRSHDPADWKKILVRNSIKAKDNLRKAEIPAVEKRICEVERKISALEDERLILYEKCEALK